LPFFRLAVKTGEGRPSEMAWKKNVDCWTGRTVLMLLKARPRRPSPGPETNWEETVWAASTAWPVTVVPPTETVSVKTLPLEEEPSP